MIIRYPLTINHKLFVDSFQLLLRFNDAYYTYQFRVVTRSYYMNC